MSTTRPSPPFPWPRPTSAASLIAVLGLLAWSFATPSAAADRWWVGGGLGLSFGSNVDYVSIEPIVGYWVNPKLTTGARAIFRSRNDKRFAEDFETTDYGAALFARYFLLENVFLQGEYEYLYYEPRFQGGDRTDVDSLFAGVGFSQSFAGRSSFFAVGLYNFTYDDDEPGPYSEPWVVRAGYGFRF